MRELTSDELNKIKEIELDILKEIDRVCKKCDIKYSLAYGTLLGAVRHQGFIPWDDDIDIMMSREEYEKFRTIGYKELNQEYYVADVEKDRDYGFFFCKVMHHGTIMKEESISRNNSPCGVFVDIFVYDILHNDLHKRNKQYQKAQRLKKTCICRSKYYFGQKGIRYFAYRFLGLLYGIVPKQWFVQSYIKNARRYENDNACEMCGHLSGLRLEQETFPRQLFKEYTTLPFEDLEAMAVADYDTVLKIRYGDYMKMPPKEQQIPHHFVTEVYLD